MNWRHSIFRFIRDFRLQSLDSSPVADITKAIVLFIRAMDRKSSTFGMGGIANASSARVTVWGLHWGL
jgi:hypothetical protein